MKGSSVTITSARPEFVRNTRIWGLRPDGVFLSEEIRTDGTPSKNAFAVFWLKNPSQRLINKHRRKLSRNAPKDASKVVESRPENFGNSDFKGLTAKTTDD